MTLDREQQNDLSALRHAPRHLPVDLVPAATRARVLCRVREKEECRG